MTGLMANQCKRPITASQWHCFHLSWSTREISVWWHRHHYLISPWTKWPPFRRRYFNCIFVNEKFCILIKISLNYVSMSPIDNNPAFCLDNGLAPNSRQAIIWTNAGPIHWRIYAALGGDELRAQYSQYRHDIISFMDIHMGRSIITWYQSLTLKCYNGICLAQVMYNSVKCCEDKQPHLSIRIKLYSTGVNPSADLACLSATLLLQTRWPR